MGTGLGKTQKEILRILAEGAPKCPAQTIGELADDPSWLGATHRQLRTAVRALERRGLVVVTKEYIGWSGEGRYGARFPRWELVEHPRGDMVRCRDGGPLHHVQKVANPDDTTTWVRGFYKPVGRREPQGMPRAGLLVWLPEERAAWLERDIELTVALARRLGGLGPEGRERLEEKQAELERLRRA
jgi:hypothetical protein